MNSTAIAWNPLEAFVFTTANEDYKCVFIHDHLDAFIKLSSFLPVCTASTFVTYNGHSTSTKITWQPSSTWTILRRAKSSLVEATTKPFASFPLIKAIAGECVCRFRCLFDECLSCSEIFIIPSECNTSAAFNGHRIANILYQARKKCAYDCGRPRQARSSAW